MLVLFDQLSVNRSCIAKVLRLGVTCKMYKLGFFLFVLGEALSFGRCCFFVYLVSSKDFNQYLTVCTKFQWL